MPSPKAQNDSDGAVGVISVDPRLMVVKAHTEGQTHERVKENDKVIHRLDWNTSEERSAWAILHIKKPVETERNGQILVPPKTENR